MVRTIFFLFLSIPLFGQQLDSTKVFPLDQYLQWVRDYHPMMKQSLLLEGRGDATILKSRGAFDPQWYGEYEDKSFDQKNYFRIGEAGLKVPTWWGIDVKLAYLWSDGDFLNRETTLPQNGQAVVGLEIPLLQGLIFDQRRAQVKKAQLYKEANEVTRRSMMNDLLLDAIESYWEWAYQYQVVRVYQSSLELAEDRFRITRESFLQGDKPAIDTLESIIQVQKRQQELSQEKALLQNTLLQLSNFLWYEDLTPLEISSQLRPEAASAELPSNVANSTLFSFQNIRQIHPGLQALTLKQEQLDISLKLKQEQFKPQLQLSYNFLGNGFDLTAEQLNTSTADRLFLENYKWGLHFKYPLLLRKERADLQLVKLEQLETAYEIEQKELQLTNKIRSILQLQETTSEQLNMQQAIVINYEALLAAENEKFRIGESSIFLLNSREQKLIEAQMKLVSLQTSSQKIYWKLEWAKGRLQ